MIQIQQTNINNYWSNAGTAYCPVGVIMAPGTIGPSTGTIKLLGMPVLFFISIDSCNFLCLNWWKLLLIARNILVHVLKDNLWSNDPVDGICNNGNVSAQPQPDLNLEFSCNCWIKTHKSSDFYLIIVRQKLGSRSFRQTQK